MFTYYFPLADENGKTVHRVNAIIAECSRMTSMLTPTKDDVISCSIKDDESDAI